MGPNVILTCGTEGRLRTNPLAMSLVQANSDWEQCIKITPAWAA